MPYNPTIHHRRSIRLKGYDYSQAGLYFITICCQDRICRFGKIENREMILNDAGKIAYDEWYRLAERYPRVFGEVFQIMPNHVQGIIGLDDVVGATLAVAQNPNPNTGDQIRAGASPAPTAATATTTIGNIIGAYKSLVTNKCLEIYKLRNEYMGKLWQRNYYEHIIRNEQSHQNIFDYIIHNPEKWQDDKFYSEQLKKQARALKSVIKLDKNFHIYIHGNRNLIEQGTDENGKFYKIYYKEEN
jgi:REP element-mobilizing transposase RayT